MHQRALTVDNSLRVLRTIRLALLVAILLYIFAAEVLLRPAAQRLNHLFYEGIAMTALACAGAAFVVRNRTLPPVFETLRKTPEDAASCARWRVGVLVCDALALSVVL